MILDGTASEGDGISFLWEQASGQPVELLDASSAVAVFDAPDTGAVLVFTLTVSLGDMSDLDVVTVIVEDDEEMVCLFYQGDGSDTHLLILDWDGDEERSPYGFGPDIPIPPFDFARYPLPDGGSLADDPGDFIADVLANVQADLDMISVLPRNHLPAEEFLLMNGDYDQDVPGTVIFVTDWQEPDNPLVLGRAIFDSSDKRWDDGGFVYGATFDLIVVESPTYEGYVNAFSDVVVHELGHTLGFGHTEDSSVPAGAEPRMGIMRGTRAPVWFLKDQGWLVDQTTWQETDFFQGCGRWEMDPTITFLDEIEIGSDKTTVISGDLRCGLFGGHPFKPSEENEAIVNLPDQP